MIQDKYQVTTKGNGSDITLSVEFSNPVRANQEFGDLKANQLLFQLFIQACAAIDYARDGFYLDAAQENN